MTRGKWVALAVGLAVVAVLVPYGPALWRAVAYQQSSSIAMHTGTISDPIYVAGWIKRWDIMPGPDVVLEHPSCFLWR